METNLMNAYEERIKPYRDVIGCAFKSFNYFHADVDELNYEVGLMIELRQLGYTVHRQEPYPIYYKGINSGVTRRLDLTIDTKQQGMIILELKAINRIEDHERRQLCAYLRITNTHSGMLINFSPKGVYTEIWEYDSTTNKCRMVKL